MMNTDGLEKISLTREEWAKIKRHIIGEAPYVDRVSIAFAGRLYTHPQAKADAVVILREIDCLESLRAGSGTKVAAIFRHPPLDKFWHKHFSSTRHLLRNVGEEWGLSRGGNRRLTTAINEVARSHGHKPEEWPGVLAHKIWLGGYETRSQERRRTGDWIIFGKHEGQNYYLDVATHEEGKKENAPQLYEKLRRGNAAEFPFLFE